MATCEKPCWWLFVLDKEGVHVERIRRGDKSIYVKHRSPSKAGFSALVQNIVHTYVYATKENLGQWLPLMGQTVKLLGSISRTLGLKWTGGRLILWSVHEINFKTRNSDMHALYDSWYCCTCTIHVYISMITQWNCKGWSKQLLLPE